MSETQQGSGPFRQKSLERLSSPERLDQLLRVVDRKSWLPLLAFAVLIAVLVLWSVIGHIPITVEGRGMLILPRKVVDFESPGTGRLETLRVQVGETVEAGQVLGTIARPDLRQAIEFRRTTLFDLRLRSETATELRSERTSLEESSSRTQRGRLQQTIQDSQALAEELRAKRRQAIAERREGLEEQIHMARELTDALAEQLEGERKLYEDELITRQAMIATEQGYMDSRGRVTDLENRLLGLRSEELEVEEEYLSRRQRIADQVFALEGLEVREKELAQENLESERGYEERIAELTVEIAELEQRLEQESRIVAEHPGRILELGAAVGQELEPGDRLGAMTVEDPGSQLVSLSLFKVRDGKRLREGQEVQVSPDTADRRRFGSIRGRIRSVSPFPVTLAEVRNVVGNEELALSLIEGGYLIRVFADLDADPDSPSGYRWGASKGPQIEITNGTTATARAVVEKRRPVAFVLPFLKSSMGID